MAISAFPPDFREHFRFPPSFWPAFPLSPHVFLPNSIFFDKIFSVTTDISKYRRGYAVTCQFHKFSFSLKEAKSILATALFPIFALKLALIPLPLHALNSHSSFKKSKFSVFRLAKIGHFGFSLSPTPYNWMEQDLIQLLSAIYQKATKSGQKCPPNKK